MKFQYGKDWMTAGKAIALAQGDLKGELCAEVREKIIASYTRVETISHQKNPVYGINTGFGPLCTTKIDNEHLSRLQENLLLSHSVGVGKSLDIKITKLMMVLKVHSLALGYSGVSITTLERIMWQLKNDIIPVVPEKGSVGASGDLAPLAHLFLPLIGEGKVKHNGQEQEASLVFKKFGLSPLSLNPKEGLALINGTQFILAHAITCISEFHACLSNADVIASMMIEGLLGSASPFSKLLHQLRPYKGNSHVAHRIHFLIDHSEINHSHENCERVQDPYSLRCIPQVHGSSRDAWLHLKEKVEIEANSVTDNPVILSDGTTISGGNFHGQPLAMALDYTKLAAAEIGNISDRRIYLSMMGEAKGVPKLLIEKTGVNSGFMILQYTSAALASENKSLCFPASADSIPTSLGQEDHVSMGSISGRKAMEVLSNIRDIQAIELLCAAQALDFILPLKPHPILMDIHKRFREKVSFATEDRYFSQDIEAAQEFISDNTILEIIEQKTKEKYGGFRTEYHELFEVY